METLPTTAASPSILRHAVAAAFGAVAVALAAQVAIPLPGTPVPFTLQPLMVLLVGALLGARTDFISGRAVALIDGKEHDVGPGDFMGFATPSVPHILRNTFDEECVYLMGGEDKPIDVVDYPDLGKRYLQMQTAKGAEFYELGEPTNPYGKAQD